MPGPKRPTGADLLRRMESWGDEWRAAAGSTAPADRPRAEVALRSMYAAAGKPAPRFAWVPSPAAGVLAYTFAALGHKGIVSPWARGDVGNGENRDFNGLVAPFGMEPAWVARVTAQVFERVPAERRPAPPPPPPAASRWAPRPSLDPVVATAEALGFGGTARTLPLVRGAAESGSRRAAPIADPTAGTAPPDPMALDGAAAVLGADWPRLVDLLGRDLAGGLFVEATRRVASRVLTDPVRRREALQAMQPGQWDAVTPVMAASRDVFGGFLWRHRDGRAEREAQAEARLELARSAGPWWALEGLAIVSERPLTLRRDDRGRPHAADGPAIAWRDGLIVHAWHGVEVPASVILHPEGITVGAIDAETNVEVRRVLVERFGEDRLVREGGSVLVHEDATGRLWRRDADQRPPGAWPWWRPRDEPIVMVEVVNSTPEPDGSRKTYFLRVPPTITTAREAVAWTFGLGGAEYRPAVES
jgi:hypothetical protein